MLVKSWSTWLRFDQVLFEQLLTNWLVISQSVVSQILVKVKAIYCWGWSKVSQMLVDQAVCWSHIVSVMYYCILIISHLDDCSLTIHGNCLQFILKIIIKANCHKVIKIIHFQQVIVFSKWISSLVVLEIIICILLLHRDIGCELIEHK